MIAVLLIALLTACAPRYAVEVYPHGDGWVRCEYRKVLEDEQGNRSLGSGWDVYRNGDSCPVYWTPN